MIRLTRSQIQPIGLDIGHDSIKMLQLEVVGQTLSVVAAAKQAFTAEVKQQPELRMPAAVGIIRRMLRENPFSGRQIVASMPRNLVHVKNLRLPLMPAADVAAAIQFEAKNVFPFDVEQAHIDFLQAGEVRQGTDVRQEVIVLAARNEEVNQFLEQLHCCTVAVQSLDVEACALFRSVERFIRRREDEQQVHVLVDIGERGSQVVIGKGSEISFFKAIEIGGRHLHDAVSRKLGITPEEARALRLRLNETCEPAGPAAARDPVRQAVSDATRTILEELGREISLCLRYYSVTFRGQRPARLRLVGGEACDGQLQTLLGSALTIPVETCRPLYSVDTSKMKPADRHGLMCEWTLAFGLGLKLTKGRFGSRDGKPRDPNAPRGDLPLSSGAEVIDLTAALLAEPAAAAGAIAGAKSGAQTPGEMAHA